MIDVRKLVKVADIADRESSMLASTMRRSNIINNIARAKLYKEEEKLQRLREDTFSALSKELGGKGKKGGLTDVLIGALGLGGTGKVIRRFGGGGGRGGSGNVPKLPKGPLGKSLSKFGRIGPLAIASTGLDFFARKQSGQSNLQAGGGALAGLGGFAGGAKIGALLGTAILPGVGTAVGGVLGGALGGLAGGNLFDRLYGQNTLRAGSDFRRIQEEERTRQQSTLFGENLDKFEIVLNKFEKKAPRFREQEEEEKIIAERIRKSTEGVPVKNRPNALMKIVDTLFDAAIILFPAAAGKKAGIKKVLANVLKSKKARTGSKFLQFSKDASKIKPETLTERMARAFKKNFGRSFNPQLSRKGQLIRESNKILKQERKSEMLAKMFKFIRIKPIKTSSKLDKKVSNKFQEFLDKKNVKDMFKGEGQVYRDTQEIDGILQIISRAFRQGTIPENMNAEQFKKTVTAFKDVMSDMMNSKVMKMTKTELDDIFRELRVLSQKGEVPRSSSSVPRIEKFLNKIYKEVGSPPPGGMVGGVFDGPDTGYLAVLHGKEIIIPEENPHTRSKGGGQRMKTNTIMMVEGNNSQPQQIMQTPKTQVVPIFVPADSFDVATKYSELIAKVTV